MGFPSPLFLKGYIVTNSRILDIIIGNSADCTIWHDGDKKVVGCYIVHVHRSPKRFYKNTWYVIADDGTRFYMSGSDIRNIVYDVENNDVIIEVPMSCRYPTLEIMEVETIID